MYELTEEHYKIAKANGLSRKVVYQRVESYYWDIERAITEIPKGKRSPWLQYKELATSNDIKCSTFLNRINLYGMTPEEAATKPIISGKERQEMGVENRKVRLGQKLIAQAQANGIGKQALYNRVYRYDWPIEDAITLPLYSRYQNKRSV